MKRSRSNTLRPIALATFLVASQGYAWFGTSNVFKELTWSPDSRWLCYTSCSGMGGGDEAAQRPTGDDFVVCLGVDSPVAARPLLASAARVFPSNSGDQAALVAGSGVFVLDLRDGRLRHLATPVEPGEYEYGKSVEGLSWAPLDDRIAYGVYDPVSMMCELYVADLTTGGVSELLGYHDGEYKTKQAARVRSVRWRGSQSLAFSSWSENGTETTYASIDLATGSAISVGANEYLGSRAHAAVIDTVLESAVLIRMPDGTSRTIALPVAKGPVHVRAGEVSPDGKAVVFEWRWDKGEEGDFSWLWSFITMEGTGWSYCRGCLSPPLWVSGDARLLYLDHGELQPPSYVILGPDGKGTSMTICRPGGTVASLQLSPDRTRFLFEVNADKEAALGIAHVDTPGFRLIRGAHSAQWLGDGSRILCRSRDDYVVAAANGTELTRIPLVSNGYAPQWVSDSLIFFRAGYGRCEYPVGDFEQYVPETLRYCDNDPVWQVNPLTGRMKPASAESVGGYAQYKPAPAGTRIPSPDGKHVAWIETRAARNGPMYLKSRIWIANADGTGSRMLLESPGNFSLGGDEDGE